MDGNMYNYGGNLWNGYTEGFQPPSLDLQSYLPTSREPFQREQSKNPLIPSPTSYMFFNYPEETAHPHYPHEHVTNINRNQWPAPPWSRTKAKPDPTPQLNGHRPADKIFKKEGLMGMPVVTSCSSNIPPPGGFCTPDSSERMLADLHTFDAPNNCASISDSPVSHFRAASGNGLKRNTAARKNPSPRKRKDKSKKAEKNIKKRTRDEEKWARNVRKKARSKGESYVSVQGKVVPPRSVRPVDCSKCKFNCPTRVSDEEREKLFRHYWKLENFKDKVDYIAGCVHEFAPLRPVSGRRSFSRRYMLKVNGKEERVCKEFFVSTFDISESTIVTYMGKKRKGPDAIADLRGKQTPSNKTPETTVRSIREHILSQTGLQGEFSRSHSDDIRNVKKLYRHYQTECELENMKPASISVYRKVYSDMHKDKSDTPVELPPDNVLMQTPKKKAKPSDNKAVVSADEDSEAFDASHSSLPEHHPSVSLANTPPSTNQISGTASPFDLGLIPSTCSGDPQHMMTASVTDKRLCSLNIPQNFAHPQQHQQHTNNHQAQHFLPQQQQQHNGKVLYGSLYPTPVCHERGPISSFMPSVWDSNRTAHSSGPGDPNVNYSSSGYPSHNHLQPSSSALSSSLFNYKISSMSTHSHTLNSETDMKNYQHTQPATASAAKTNTETKKSSESKIRKSRDSKIKKETKKRTRNEDQWGRNVRKRLRFKGEAYTSVRGKLVEAKRVKEVDCSKCKFKCTTRVTDEQRETLNQYYWGLDTYKKKIEFLNKYVETYTPKRKMTGRRAFSRKYTFDIDDKEERVCKDFFKATLHISESTIATALEKSRKGPEAIVDMRGKHKPVNKTTEETLQSIRELIIYLTGMRPHKTSNNSRLGSEYRDVNRLYQVYKYDCEKKSKKVASLGIFRNVLVKEFGIKSVKLKNDSENGFSAEKGSNAAPCIGSHPLGVTDPVPVDTWLTVPQVGANKKMHRHSDPDASHYPIGQLSNL